MATVSEIRDRARRDAAATLEVHWSAQPMPVDPVVIARELGIQVYRAQLDGDTFGMLTWSRGGAEMYLEGDQAPTRMRFTAAHEIGHYVDRTSTIDPELGPTPSFVDRRSDDTRGTPDEIYANEFAGSLLMPEAELRPLLASGMSDIQIADYFDVSLQALRYRKSLLGVAA
jgi:Zn-dependent peptidase ImmA (M78 family)